MKTNRRRPASPDRSPFLRRHPRWRRLHHRLRAFLASCRRDGSRPHVPVLAGMGALFAVAFLAATLPSVAASRAPADGPPGGDGPPAATGPAASVPVDGPGTGALSLPPSDAESTGAPASDPAPSGEDPGPLPGEGTGPAPSRPTSGAGGVDCTEGSPGAAALRPLRDPALLQDSAARFLSRRESLIEALSGTTSTFLVLPLDEAAGTEAFILARTRVGAENLNGYYYFLFDPSGPSAGIAPLVLVVDRLFTDEDRERAFAEGDFSTPEVERALRAGLAAVLGAEEGERASGFLSTLYREVFAARVAGAGPTETRRFLSLPSCTVVFQDSFMTYVEFLPGGAP